MGSCCDIFLMASHRARCTIPTTDDDCLPLKRFIRGDCCPPDTDSDGLHNAMQQCARFSCLSTRGGCFCTLPPGSTREDGSPRVLHLSADKNGKRGGNDRETKVLVLIRQFHSLNCMLHFVAVSE